MVDKLKIIHQDKFKEMIVMIVMRVSTNKLLNARYNLNEK
jgi:hypothetical protein